MRCVAVLVDIDVDIDAVILWDRDDEKIAYAYFDGKVTMARPLAAASFDDCVTEVRDAFNIGFARVTRIQEWMQI